MHACPGRRFDNSTEQPRRRSNLYTGFIVRKRVRFSVAEPAIPDSHLIFRTSESGRFLYLGAVSDSCMSLPDPTAL